MFILKCQNEELQAGFPLRALESGKWARKVGSTTNYVTKEVLKFDKEEKGLVFPSVLGITLLI